MTRPLTLEEVYPAGAPGVSSRFVTLRTRIRVRIAESTSAAGTPVLMLPGWGASLYMYRHAFDLLPPRGFRPIAVDLRGFGFSDKPTWRRAYSTESYVEDFVALLDALALDRVSVVGQSMGGGVALHAALRHPERIANLVLINPVGLTRVAIVQPMRLPPVGVAAMLGRILVPRFVIAGVLRYLAYGDASLVTERDIDEYWAPTQVPGFVQAARRAISEFAFDPLPRDEIDALRVRSLVMLGQQDRLVRGAYDAASRIPGATIRELYGGHCVHEEHSGVSYALIGRFLAGESV